MQADFRQLNLSELQSDANARLTRIRSSWKICLAVVSLALVAFAPTVQAAYAEFGDPVDPSVDQTVDMDLNGRSVSIIHEQKIMSVRSSEYNLKLDFKVAFATIRFNGEAVMLDGIDFNDGPNAKAMIIGPHGMSIVSAGMPISRLASSVRTIGLANMKAAKGVRFDFIGVAAIPEPSAALLFSAGLSAIGVSIRRKR